MSSAACRRPKRPQFCLAACLTAAALLQGCGKQTAEEAFDLHAKENPNFQKGTVAKVAGRVTVDGQPPAKGAPLFIILHEAGKLDAAAHGGTLIKTFCKPDGTFAFTTYLDGDGVPTGKYVVAFVEFRPPRGGIGRRGFGNSSETIYAAPDELKNLYSDPDKNKTKPEFNIDVEPPGKDDYDFNLTVAGQTPVPEPGPNAVKQIKIAR